ncbi:hypothetical protein WH96_02425 [Kiloniella spongiae]|uniref:DUF2125 domain-containing protein n=1 Tax=Kiloniella spongiae TaxID=1489064 RepID=A0A0H2MJJ0_9PROT|nr:DUF2125 domain-containing protein [Kiloniella spongiae]KLN62381.1 hypothetical protein WH96_02425 [Kiloniella spongiae]
MMVDTDKSVRQSSSIAKKLITSGLILCLLCLSFSVAFWFWAANQMETSLNRWSEKQRSRGFEISHSPLSVSGFPFLVRAELEEARIKSPEGWYWQTSRLSAEATPWSPLSMIIDLSANHIIDGLPNNHPAITIESEWAKSTAQLTLEGELLNARLQADKLVITRKSHHPLTVATLDTTLGPLKPASAGNSLQEFNILIKAQDINHPELNKTPLESPISQLNLDGTLYGAIPKTKLKKALHIWRDTGGFLSLHDMSLRWGPLLLDARGKITVDNQLRPSGHLDSRIEGAGAVVKKLEKTGIINKGQSFGIKLSLAALGKTNERGRHEIAVPLIMKDGWLSIGPVTLLRLPPVSQ